MEVKFINYVSPTLWCLQQDKMFKAEIKAVLRKDLWLRYSNPEDKNPCYSYLVHLSTTECDQFEQNAVQVHSTSSLITRNQDSTKYWKYSPRCSIAFHKILEKLNIRGRTRANRSLLQYSLLPSSQLLYGQLTFNQFEGLYQPLSRSNANKCLTSLIDQVRRSLEELHNQHSIAHMDVRLPNICFTRSFTVKLNDLDQREPAT